MVSSNDDGIQKVIDDEGKYAFFMESASIEYIVERKCKVTQVGGLLDNKVDLCSSLNHLMSAGWVCGMRYIEKKIGNTIIICNM